MYVNKSKNKSANASKAMQAASEVKTIPQENYDITFEVTDSQTGKKTRMTKRVHSWEKASNLKNMFDLMCYRLAGFSNTAKLIIEEI